MGTFSTGLWSNLRLNEPSPMRPARHRKPGCRITGCSDICHEEWGPTIEDQVSEMPTLRPSGIPTVNEYVGDYATTNVLD